MIKLSIITINFNDVVGLKRTFESVVKQTSQEFEYVVIDGGSNDGSKELLQEYDKYLDFWISEPDKGIYNAMNKGVARAHGEYLLFLNSGDALYSEKTIENSLGYIKNSEKDIYYGNSINRGETDYLWTFPKDLTFLFFYKTTLSHQASFIRKSCLTESGGYDEDLIIASDWKFYIIGLVYKKYSFEYIDEIISFFYLDGISNTNRILALKERELVLKTEFSWFITDYKEYQLLKEEHEALKLFFETYKLNLLRNIACFFKDKFFKS